MMKNCVFTGIRNLRILPSRAYLLANHSTSSSTAAAATAKPRVNEIKDLEIRPIENKSKDGPTDLQKLLYPDNTPTNPKDVVARYNKNAAAYTRTFQEGWGSTLDLVSTELDIHLPKLGGPISLLDAGCGDGALADMFDFKPYDISLHGVDGAKNMLSIAKRKGKYNKLGVLNLVKELPFANDTFDIIVANGVFGYMKDHKHIYNFMRVLKPGGHFVFSMREHRFREEGYPKAISDMSAEWEIVRRELFDPFPLNPAFKHTYLMLTLRKNN